MTFQARAGQAKNHLLLRPTLVRMSGSPYSDLPRLRSILLVVGLLVVFPLILTTPFWRNVGILSLIFSMAAMGWNVLGGYAGQISFGNAMFFGVGAYSTALLVKAGWSPWPTFMVGAAVAAALGVAVGFPCFRLRSHYFAIATIAAGEIVDIVVNANASLGASSGIDIPTKSSSFANLQFAPTDTEAYYYVALLLAVIIGAVLWFFVRGRTGTYARSVRDDEEAAEAAGVPARRYKTIAVVVAAAVTAVGGSFYAMYTLFVDPSLVLDLSVSINIVLMVILGGSGTFWGPLAGAWVLTLLQQYTRQQFGSTASGMDLLIFGFLIVVIVIIEPGGLVAMTDRVVAGTRFAIGALAVAKRARR